VNTEAEKRQFVLDKVIPPYRQVADGLKSLGAPGRDEAKVEDFLNSYYNEITALEAAPAKGLSDQPIFAEAQKLAFKYGLKACEY
jgi:hypothetical protein